MTTDIERVLGAELEAERRRNEDLQMQLFNAMADNKELVAESMRWRQCAIVAQQTLDELKRGEL